MFCSVLPYTRSLDDSLLTYILPKEYEKFVQIGSCVQIPWGSDEILGIVADISESIPFEGEIKPILRPHSTVPWLAPHEITLAIQLARKLFTRIHSVLQLFLPEGLFDLFGDHNYLDLIAPVSPSFRGSSTYTIAPSEEALADHLRKSLSQNPGAVILPEGVSVKWWGEHYPNSIIDHHPKSVSSQKKIYLDILHGRAPILFGTRRSLLKRLGHYSNLYIIHEQLSSEIVFGRRRIPLWILVNLLESHGHTIHYLALTPSVRTLTRFLVEKKTVNYI